MEITPEEWQKLNERAILAEKKVLELEKVLHKVIKCLDQLENYILRLC